MKPLAIAVTMIGCLSAAFLSTGQALACFCELQPEKRVIELSDTVVFGRVTKVEVRGDRIHATVHVERTIKGKPAVANVVEFVTKGGTAQCGYRFKASNRPLTIAATSERDGALVVDNCTMYSLKRSDRKKAALAAAAAKKARQKTISVACTVTGGAGQATCDAVCPEERRLVSCAHSAGKLASGDTCASLGRIFAGPTGATGQPSDPRHDRCRVAAVCSEAGRKISVQSWATCELASGADTGGN